MDQNLGAAASAAEAGNRLAALGRVLPETRYASPARTGSRLAQPGRATLAPMDAAEYIPRFDANRDRYRRWTAEYCAAAVRLFGTGAPLTLSPEQHERCAREADATTPPLARSASARPGPGAPQPGRRIARQPDIEAGL